MQEKYNGFTFVVLSYNHEKYILEHLESIKYLVEKYADAIVVELIISDDKSSDKTVLLIENWLLKNSGLFHKVISIFNTNNIGTCKSLLNSLDKVSTNRVKITAGDDLYSFENIFLHGDLDSDTSIIFGVPLYLVNDVLSEKKISTLNTIATDIIYKRKLPSERFKKLSLNNAPNAIYASQCLFDERVLSSLEKYDVIEDWPLQISIAEYFPLYKVKTINKVFVYYRRTSGSTYIVENNRFYKDKVMIYEELIDKEKKLYLKFLLKVRLLCFKSKSKYVNIFLNLSFYEYVFRFFLNIKSILNAKKNTKLELNSHIRHYLYIKSKSLN